MRQWPSNSRPVRLECHTSHIDCLHSSQIVLKSFYWWNPHKLNANCDVICQYWIQYSITFSMDFPQFAPACHTHGKILSLRKYLFGHYIHQPTNMIEGPKGCQTSYFLVCIWANCFFFGGFFSFSFLSAHCQQMKQPTFYQNHWDIQYQHEMKRFKAKRYQASRAHNATVPLSISFRTFVNQCQPCSLAKTENHSANINERKSRVVSHSCKTSNSVFELMDLCSFSVYFIHKIGTFNHFE